jgi:hypothetical protein
MIDGKTETCRCFSKNKKREMGASGWFYYRNI